MSAIDGHTLVYDANNNPKTYYNGQTWTFTWKEGRQLATATCGNTSVSCQYDAEGLRTSKTVDGVTYDYTYLGNKLVRQSWSGNTIDFAYDDQGRPYSLNYNGNIFYYILNLQDDVVRIVNSAGVVRAEYTYNAWGELLSASGPVCNLNPLRYRGYVYDDETGLYYLNSRYYDPANRRFVNADATDVLAIEQGSPIQYNLFAYCLNNPVNGTDSDGLLLHSIVTGAVIGGIVGAAWGGFTAALTGDDIIAGAKSGGISGAITGALGGVHAVKFATESALLIGRVVVGGIAGFSSYAYTCSKNNAEMNALGGLTAFTTGAAAAAFSGANMFSDAPALGVGILCHVTTGASSVLTTIAHTSGQPKRTSTTKTLRSGRTIIKPRRTTTYANPRSNRIIMAYR